MEINICKKLCGECPFSKNALPSWLAGYTTDDIATMQNQEVLFPCHLTIPHDMNHKEAEAAIKRGELKLCRGYVESLVKSCKMPKTNQYLRTAREQVKLEGVSENSMSIWDFTKHHSKWTIKN